nr:hypothetical protein [Tanacetum cinerariifolium]
MMEVRFRNKHSNGLVIEEIVQEVGLNEDVKEDLGNKGKQVETSPKKLHSFRERKTSDQFAFRNLLAEIDLEETNDDASISGLEGDFPTWVNDDFLDQANEVEWQHYSYYALEDEEDIAGMFAELDQAYKENVVSHLDEPVVFEEVWDMGLFDNIRDQMFYREMGDREVVNQVFVGDPVDNEMTNDDAIESSCSIVPIRRSMKRKRVEFEETASEYAPFGNPRKRRRLNKDERCATDFVNDVGE